MSNKNCFLLFLQTCQQAPYQQDAALAQPSVISVLQAKHKNNIIVLHNYK
jgi:hypothetical protein